MIGDNLLAPEPTLLPPYPEVDEAIRRGDSLESVVRAYPDSPLAWALLAQATLDDGRHVEGYAYARVGYHRGLDALRKSGWRGTGPVPWSHEPNRGVLHAFVQLRRAAEAIGETAEVSRLRDLLRDSDPQAEEALSR